MEKAAKLPVCKLLGQVTDKVQGYASAGFYAPGKTLENLRKKLKDISAAALQHLR